MNQLLRTGFFLAMKQLNKDRTTVAQHRKFAAQFKDQKSYDRAVDEYNKAILKDSSNKVLYCQLAFVLKEQKRYPEALLNFKKSLDCDQKYLLAIHGLGLTYLAMDRVQQAIAQFQREIALDNQYSGGYQGLARVYKRLKNYQQAMKNYKAALAINPKNVGCLNNLGNTLNALKRFQEAQNTFRQAIAIDPEQPSVYLGLAKALKKQGRLAQAQQQFAKAIAADDQFAPAYSALGALLLQQREWDRALINLKRAVELQINQQSTYRNLALAYANLNQMDLAKLSIQKAILLQKNPKSQLVLLDIELKLKNIKVADQVRKNLEQTLKSAQVRTRYGITETDLKNLKARGELIENLKLKKAKKQRKQVSTERKDFEMDLGVEGPLLQFSKELMGLVIVLLWGAKHKQSKDEAVGFVLQQVGKKLQYQALATLSIQISAAIKSVGPQKIQTQIASALLSLASLTQLAQETADGIYIFMTCRTVLQDIQNQFPTLISQKVRQKIKEKGVQTSPKLIQYTVRMSLKLIELGPIKNNIRLSWDKLASQSQRPVQLQSESKNSQPKAIKQKKKCLIF